MYAAYILKETKNETPRLEEFHVLQEFRDVFPDEIPRLPPKRDIFFTIEHVLGAAPVSKTLHNEYTRDVRVEDATARVVGEKVYQVECVFLGSTNFVCKEERWYTQIVY